MARVPASERTRNALEDMFAGKTAADKSSLVRQAARLIVPATSTRPATLHMMACLAVITMLSGCANNVPGAKAYWDAKVKEMCEKDGGVQIFDKLRVSKAEINLLGRVGEKIDVPVKSLAKPNSPAYADLTMANIKEGDLQVTRTEATIVRRADQAIVARWVIYTRSGGDFGLIADHPSSFRCPSLTKIVSDLQQLFVIEGESK